jgi:pentatricopeptide repeat protein
MITLSENSERDVKPNLISFNTVIDAWAKSKEPNAAENALNILQQMENISESLNDTSIYPDTISYSSVISAIARSEKRNAGLQAVELLERSLELYSNGMETLKPDSISFCTTLDALSKQSQFDQESIRVAQQMFRRMKQMGEDSDSSVQPTTIAYNIMLKIYASSGEIEELKLLFEDMLDSYKKGDIHVAPDDITYNTYLSALSNAKEGVYVKEALRMLREGEEDENVNLSVNAYVHVLGALAKQTRHGENFLKEIEKLLDSLEARFLDRKSEIMPNTACYNCYIDALSKCAFVKDKSTRAMEVLSRMKNFSKQCSSSLTLPLPDAITYTSIINTISYSENDNTKMAEDLISQMKAEGLKPNRYTYNSLVREL